MKLFLDPAFAGEQAQYGQLAVSPFALYHLPGSASMKTAFLREEMFSVLEQSRFYESVPSPEAADVVFMPFNLTKVRELAPEVERHYRRLAERAGKPLLLDHFGDSTADVEGDNAIVLRTSKFRSELRRNEIICPPVIEDIGEIYNFAPLAKPERPSIGFVGLAQKRSGASYFSHLLPYGRDDYLYSVLRLLSPRYGRQRSGIYFRRKALRALESAPGIKTDFTTRAFWGRGKRARNRIGHQEIRAEFIENMRRNLYLLSVRGRGNFSLRFFEILSAGRIPVQIDTDTPLPLEDELDYQSFSLIHDWTQISNLPARLKELHEESSDETLRQMQEAARNAFQTRLRFDRFTKHLFEERLPRVLRRGPFADS